MLLLTQNPGGILLCGGDHQGMSLLFHASANTDSPRSLFYIAQVCITLFFGMFFMSSSLSMANMEISISIPLKWISLTTWHWTAEVSNLHILHLRSLHSRNRHPFIMIPIPLKCIWLTTTLNHWTIELTHCPSPESSLPKLSSIYSNFYPSQMYSTHNHIEPLNLHIVHLQSLHSQNHHWFIVVSLSVPIVKSSPT